MIRGRNLLFTSTDPAGAITETRTTTCTKFYKKQTDYENNTAHLRYNDFMQLSIHACDACEFSRHYST